MTQYIITPFHILPVMQLSESHVLICNSSISTTHGFRLLQQDETSTLKLQELSDDAEDGYIFKVDIHYPTHLHDRHDDYPLAPESLVIDHSMYSSTPQAVFPETAPQRKLTPNLRDKVKFVVHYRKLNLYLQFGLVVNKVHRVLTFKQCPWLEAYIDFNTRQRSLAGDSFLKDFFKLMNNSVFGKKQENLRNRVHVELITDARIANGFLNQISAEATPLMIV